MLVEWHAVSLSLLLTTRRKAPFGPRRGVSRSRRKAQRPERAETPAAGTCDTWAAHRPFPLSRDLPFSLRPGSGDARLIRITATSARANRAWRRQAGVGPSR